jgi:hypothetical protein
MVLKDISKCGGESQPRGKKGEWRAFLPLYGESAFVTVTSVSAADVKKSVLPWWDGFGRPLISWKCENFNGMWLPGVFTGMHVEGSCAIMACVFAESSM